MSVEGIRNQTPPPAIGATQTKTVTDDKTVGGGTGAMKIKDLPDTNNLKDLGDGLDLSKVASDVLTGLENALDKVANGNGKGNAEATLAGLLDALRSTDRLAELMIEFAGMSRDQALQSRLDAREAARANLMGQASETRDAAAKAFAGAMVMGALSLAGAAVSIGGSAMSLKSAKGAFDAGMEGMTAAKQAKQMEVPDNAMIGTHRASPEKAASLNETAKVKELEGNKLNSQAQSEVQVAQAIGQLLTTSGSAVNSGLEYSAKLDEAEGQEMAAEAQVEQSNQDFAKKMMEEIEELVRSVIAFVKQMQQAETDLMQNFTRV